MGCSRSSRPPRGWSPVKVAFNAGQTLIAIGLATAGFEALGSRPASEPLAWVEAAAAMAGFQLVTAVLTGSVIALVEQRSPKASALLPSGTLLWAGNVVLGILAALVWTLEPVALPLLGVPLGLSFFAYRGWMSTLQQRDRMHEMARTAGSISAGGDLSKRLPDAGHHDEVKALSITLNEMLGRLDSSFSRERLFIRETSHELRTPITICRGHLELLGSEPPQEEMNETVTLVLDELDRMARIVEDMSTLARIEDPATLRLQDVPVERLISDIAAKALPLLGSRLHVEPVRAGAIMHGDPQRLTQALINLLNNTHEHTPHGAPVKLRAVDEGTSWRFDVADTGGGLKPGQEDDVFRPFFTGKGSAGSGLGLAIIRAIARAHGGSAGVENRPGEGATFWVRVPA